MSSASVSSETVRSSFAQYSLSTQHSFTSHDGGDKQGEPQFAYSEALGYSVVASGVRLADTATAFARF